MIKPGAGLFDEARYAMLTPRERDVMTYVAKGKPNKIIAAELGVSQRTIEAHRARIFQKLRVRNAVELAHRLLGSEAYLSHDMPPVPCARCEGRRYRDTH
ncbi:MAG TPA: LuxR C-terminal-related transcriptional regulator [Burkholderiaceae bacterium]|nr:LuxR C-terminal-related transcriptional regulator [Burkholderiaceae bacterium]